MGRNNLGIIQTPRIDISDLSTGEAKSYVGTDFEKVVEIIKTGIANGKLIFFDLFNNVHHLYGIPAIIDYGSGYYLKFGGYGQDIGGEIILDIYLSTQKVTIEVREH